jgi:hypothetical protein
VTVTQPELEISAEQVAVAWVKGLGTAAGTAVATTVPAASSWPIVAGTTSRAFIQVMGTGGGTVGDTPLHRDIVSIDSWAVKDNSDRPPIGLAVQLLLKVWGAAMSRAQSGGVLDVGGGQTAVLLSSRPMNAHPRRIPDQDQSRAHYSLDVEITWTTEEDS